MSYDEEHHIDRTAEARLRQLAESLHRPLDTYEEQRERARLSPDRLDTMRRHIREGRAMDGDMEADMRRIEQIINQRAPPARVAASEAASFQTQRTAAEREASIEEHIHEIMAQLGVTDSSKGGVSQEYLDSLERIENKYLKPDDECAICATPHLEDEYPLVVALPCRGHHRFDLDCIGKWLERSTTCPMCRTDLLVKPEAPQEDEEDPLDDMYG